MAAGPAPGGADTEMGDDGAAGCAYRPAAPASLSRSLALVPDGQPRLPLAARRIGEVVTGGAREDRVRVKGGERRVADGRAIDAGVR